MTTEAPAERSAILSSVLPFSLALGGYVFLALASRADGRLPLWIWWGVQGVGWCACLFFWRATRRGWPALRWIVLSAVLFRLCGLWMTPSLEDDYERYLWDGWRTIRDGSPYDRAPEEFFTAAESRPPGIETALNELNYPDLKTIYSPVTQLLFAAAAAIAPGSLLIFKLLLLLVDIALLLLLMPFGGRAAVWFYGWCPLVVTETAFHAHPEGWGLFWLIAAWVCARRERWFLAAALAGLAVCAKIFALLAIPFMAWGRAKVFVPAFLLVLGAIYGPILASGSTAEWAGMRAMASHFEFNSLGYAVIAYLFGERNARRLWVILFAVIAALLCVRWARRGHNLPQAPVREVMLSFFLLTPVLNPWYLAWLVPFVALRPTRGAIALLLVVPLSYATGLNLGEAALPAYGQPAWVRPLEFGVVLLAAASYLWLVRIRLTRT